MRRYPVQAGGPELRGAVLERAQRLAVGGVETLLSVAALTHDAGLAQLAEERSASQTGWRNAGPGVAPMVHEFLYDAEGNVVGSDQPLLQIPQPDGYSHAQACAWKKGFQRAVFSSTLELYR